MEMLDIKKFMGEIRLYISKNLDAICQDENKKNDTLENHTNIDKVLWFKYTFKTIKLLSIIILVSYFLGIFFYIFIEITSVKDYQDNHDDDISESLKRNDFISSFGFSSESITRKTTIMIYYSFTSLSTVGFGDYHPKSDQERVFITAVLLLGVAVFSMVLGNFNGIMIEIF